MPNPNYSTLGARQDRVLFAAERSDDTICLQMQPRKKKWNNLWCQGQKQSDRSHCPCPAHSNPAILRTRRDVRAVSQICWRSISEFISLKLQPESVAETGKTPSCFFWHASSSIMDYSVSAGIQLGPGIGYVTNKLQYLSALKNNNRKGQEGGCIFTKVLVKVL